MLKVLETAGRIDVTAARGGRKKGSFNNAVEEIRFVDGAQSQSEVFDGRLF